jgi:hypothetical protein
MNRWLIPAAMSRVKAVAVALWLVLITTHVVLGLWAMVGFVEWFWATAPWPRITNPLFPRGVLLLQWGLSLAAAALFLGGYALRWSRTPTALAVVYAAMALLCAVQTFHYMHGTTRFVALAVEYMAYAGILIFLHRSEYFRPGMVPAAQPS